MATKNSVNSVASAAEANILDGATLTTTELNHVDGVTSPIQTQIDGKADKSGALTQFVGNTAWRVFYSDSAGDVTELALGASGTYLKSNGASSAPTFATPAGSGDVSKVGTPVNNQVGVWTGDGTIEGDAALVFDTTTNSLVVGVEDVLTNYIRGADATTLNADGGGLTIIGGAGNGSGNGGVIDIQTGDLTGQITVTGQPAFYGATGQYVFYEPTGIYTGTFDFNSISGSTKTFTFPNTTGNVVIDANANTFTATQTFANVATQNIEPVTDDTYYLGKNDDDTPKAWKGVILKDTADGKYYRIEVTNGVVTATDLTD